MTTGAAVLLSLATTAAALLTSCGTDRPKAIDEATASAGSADRPACNDLVGETMTEDFGGCESGGLFIGADKIECADGRLLVIPAIAEPGALSVTQINESVWGFVGQPMQAGSGDGELYAAMSIDCTDEF